MEIVGRKVVLEPEEVISECPLKPKWAAAMLQMYGVDNDYRGRLGKFSRCPDVLKLAGYEVEIQESA